MHHKNPDWKDNDVERYIQWNPEDLVILSHSEHRKIHSTGMHLSDETKKKIGENVSKSLKGHSVSEETKQKLRKAKLKNNPGCTGMHWKLIDGKRVYY